MVTTMKLHHCPEVIKADYERSEALGLALLDSLGCLGIVPQTVTQAPQRLRLVHRWTRKFDLVTGEEKRMWVTEAA